MTVQKKNSYTEIRYYWVENLHYPDRQWLNETRYVSKRTYSNGRSRYFHVEDYSQVEALGRKEETYFNRHRTTKRYFDDGLKRGVFRRKEANSITLIKESEHEGSNRRS